MLARESPSGREIKVSLLVPRIVVPAVAGSNPVGYPYIQSLAIRGVYAVKGTWEDEHTFVIDRLIVGQGPSERWTLTFDAEKLNVLVKLLDGREIPIDGQTGGSACVYGLSEVFGTIGESFWRDPAHCENCYLRNTFTLS